MKNKRNNSDSLHTILICLCLLVIAFVEMFTSGILKKTDTRTQSTAGAMELTQGHEIIKLSEK